jgi:hypothetical protein
MLLRIHVSKRIYVSNREIRSRLLKKPLNWPQRIPELALGRGAHGSGVMLIDGLAERPEDIYSKSSVGGCSE